jgi:hypothetical protein
MRILTGNISRTQITKCEITEERESKKKSENTTTGQSAGRNLNMLKHIERVWSQRDDEARRSKKDG